MHLCDYMPASMGLALFKQQMFANTQMQARMDAR